MLVDGALKSLIMFANSGEKNHNMLIYCKYKINDAWIQEVVNARLFF